MSGPAHPGTRPGDPKVHLCDGSPYALCGRPAGNTVHVKWTWTDHLPPVKDRCPDCVTAGQHLPHRPAVPIYPWRP